MTTEPLTLLWTSYVDSHQNADSLPAVLGTPDSAWSYGAVTDLVHPTGDADVVIDAQALKGKIGLALVSPDHSTLVSRQFVIAPDAGRTTIRLPLTFAKAPARILVRNYGDPGVAGEIQVFSAGVELA